VPTRDRATGVDTTTGSRPEREIGVRSTVSKRLLGRGLLQGWELRSTVVYISFIVLFLVFAVALRHDGFLTQTNLFNVVLQAGTIAIMSCVYVLVLSAGEIDLSIGAIVPLSALVTASVLQSHGFVVGSLAGVGTGLAVGGATAFLVTVVGIPSFLVTLAMMAIVTGLARSINHLQTISVSNNTFVTYFGSGKIAGVSTLFLWMVLVAVACTVAFHFARLGAHVRATGDNQGVAAAVGIRVRRVRALVLILSAVAAALAGMLYAGRIQSASYTLGETDLLTVIAAVIIGGTSLFGGRGTVPGALVGSLLLAMLNNGLILAGLNVQQQSIALGVLIIVAVILGRDRQLSR
jgi:ribose transport system permease protein